MNAGSSALPLCYVLREVKWSFIINSSCFPDPLIFIPSVLQASYTTTLPFPFSTPGSLFGFPVLPPTPSSKTFSYACLTPGYKSPHPPDVSPGASRELPSSAFGTRQPVGLFSLSSAFSSFLIIFFSPKSVTFLPLMPQKSPWKSESDQMQRSRFNGVSVRHATSCTEGVFSLGQEQIIVRALHGGFCFSVQCNSARAVACRGCSTLLH